MKTWKVVGWYATDPLDTSTPPVSFTLTVEAASRHEAFTRGELALLKAAGPRKRELLNWYVEPVVVK